MRGLVLAVMLGAGVLAQGQRAAMPPVETQAGPPHRTRLILKDGTYQMVRSYKLVRDRVQYVSAERGETEEIPVALVDLEATRKWEKQHLAQIDPEAQQQEKGPPVIDPELAKEEADRAAITPEVAPDLRLPAELSMVAMDTWRGGAELVPLSQQQTDLNKETGHGVLRGIISPRSAAHQVVQLKGEKADVQLHVSDPVMYVRIDDAQVSSGQAMTVDTHGANASGTGRKSTEPGEYVVVRVDVRQDARVVTSFQASLLGERRQADVTETTVTTLPGGHWAKIVPKENLLIGEYALVEVLGEKEINLGVWDFGVHPTAGENRDVVKPEKKRAVELGRRRPE